MMFVPFLPSRLNGGLTPSFFQKWIHVRSCCQHSPAPGPLQVRPPSPVPSTPLSADILFPQRFQGRRSSHGLLPRRRMGDQEHPCQRHQSRIHGCLSLPPPFWPSNEPSLNRDLGISQTALTRVILERDPALKEAWVNLTPMGRIGEPEDLKVLSLSCRYLIRFEADAAGFLSRRAPSSTSRPTRVLSPPVPTCTFELVTPLGW